MAFNPFLQEIGLGWIPNSSANSNTSQALSTGNRVAMGFISSTTSTLSTVRIYCSAVTSSPANTDLVAGIFANGTTGAGPTGAALEEKNCTGSPAVGWVDFTGFTQAVTKNVQYWIAFRNNGGAPSATIRKPTGQYQTYGTSSAFGFGYRLSTDSGTTWTADAQFGRVTCRIGLADGSYIGFPIESESRADSSAAGDRVQSAVEVGTRFSTPAGVKLNVLGMGMKINKAGSPAGTFRYRLYKGTGLVATTDAVAADQLSGSDARYTELYFTGAQTLDESTVYRAVLAATGSDTGANYFGTDIYVWDADSNSVDIKPLNGTSQKTVFTGTWAETATNIVPVKLILGSPPYTATGGGGGGSNLIVNQSTDSM